MDIQEIQQLKTELESLNAKVEVYNYKKSVLEAEVKDICNEFGLDPNNSLGDMESLIAKEEEALAHTITEAKQYIAIAKEELTKLDV